VVKVYRILIKKEPVDSLLFLFLRSSLYVLTELLKLVLTLTLHKKGGKCAYKPLQLRIILLFMGNIRCHLRWPLDFA